MVNLIPKKSLVDEAVEVMHQAKLRILELEAENARLKGELEKWRQKFLNHGC